VPDLKTKQEIVNLAKDLARDHELVQKGSVTYIPAHWDTLDVSTIPSPLEKVWIPMSLEDKKEFGNFEGNILFYTEGDLRSFNLVLGQFAQRATSFHAGLLIRTPAGLRLLRRDGTLDLPSGDFVANYIRPMLNDDVSDKSEVFETIREWVGGDPEVADSLLYHLATSLAPHYSAVKYVLLLGEGRNGKGLLLTMLSSLFGVENLSSVSRQEMAERRATVTQLNGKLLNVIFDGEMAYIKDSSSEKTLIAGEPLDIEMKYENAPTRVQTNCLFIEALNTEPKARDKTTALQKRLVRFQFPNVYPIDKAFEQKMTSDRYLGAFLSLLLDHYVQEHEIPIKLKLTQASVELQLEQMWLGNPVLQYMEHLALQAPGKLDELQQGKLWVEDFLNSFKPWAETQGMQERNDGDIVNLMKTVFVIGSKTRNKNQKRSTQRYIKELRQETELVYQQLKGVNGGTGLQQEEVVGD
jgi:phage/plasmid-associated DNA primase